VSTETTPRRLADEGSLPAEKDNHVISGKIKRSFFIFSFSHDLRNKWYCLVSK
jgi:hypothetical protein